MVLACRTVLKVHMCLMLCRLYMGTLWLLIELGKSGGPFAVASGRPLEWNGFLTTSCELWKGRTIWKSQSGNVGAAELAVVLVQSFIFSKKS